jgi:hypothetical protein
MTKLRQWIFTILLLSLKLFSGNVRAEVPENVIVNPSDVASLSFLLASPRGSGQSSFGHAYLRFNMKVGLESKFPTYEFYAAMESETFFKKMSSYVRAAGIGHTDRRIAKKTFIAVSQEITVNEDRTLFSYDLKLERSALESVVTKINQLISNGGKMGSYSFLTSNCASAITDIFVEAKIPLEGWGKGIPLKVPSLLKSNGLLAKTKVYRSNSDQRKDLLLRYRFILDKIKSPFSLSYFELMLSEKSLLRMFGLKHLKQWSIHEKVNALNQNEFKKLTYVLKTYLLYENALTRHLFMEFSETLKAVPIHSYEMTERIKQSRFKTVTVDLARSSIECEKLECYFKSKLVGQKNSIKSDLGHDEKLDIKIKIPNIEVVNGNLIYDHEREVGFISQNGRVVLSGIVPVVNLNKKSGSLFMDLGMLYDLDQSQFNVPRKISKKDDFNFYKNGVLGFAMCSGMNDLQKKLLVNTLFDPDQQRLSDEQNLNLIDDLMKDKIVVIPGFHSVLEYTSSLNQELFAAKVYSYYLNQYGSISKAVSGWFEQNTVKRDAIPTMIQWLSHGIILKIGYKVANKGNIGHVMLITKLTEKDDRWIIAGYDSNLGYDNNLAYIRKSDMFIVTLNYGSNPFFWYEDENYEQQLDMRSLTSGYYQKFLLKISRSLKKYSFSMSELINLN